MVNLHFHKQLSSRTRQRWSGEGIPLRTENPATEKIRHTQHSNGSNRVQRVMMLLLLRAGGASMRCENVGRRQTNSSASGANREFFSPSPMNPTVSVMVPVAAAAGCSLRCAEIPSLAKGLNTAAAGTRVPEAGSGCRWQDLFIWWVSKQYQKLSLKG